MTNDVELTNLFHFGQLADLVILLAPMFSYILHVHTAGINTFYSLNNLTAHLRPKKMNFKPTFIFIWLHKEAGTSCLCRYFFFQTSRVNKYSSRNMSLLSFIQLIAFVMLSFIQLIALSRKSKLRS